MDEREDTDQLRGTVTTYASVHAAQYPDDVAWPGEQVEKLRLEAACRLLETTGHAVDHIPRTCGSGRRRR